MTLTGAQIMCEALLKEGVDVLFGYPGGAIMPFYHALPEYPQLRHVLVRHEQAAGHAAEGYARTSGKVGVCVATSGPGATNLVTALADAMMDSVPLVAITGQVPTALIGKDAFQETDVTGITQPITKHNYLVTDIRDLTRVIKEAFHIARSGRPGPVLVDIAKDVQQARAEFSWPEQVHLPGYHAAYEGNRFAIREAAHLISQAEKPLIMAGRGVLIADASAELVAFAEKKTGIPVVTTLLGISAIPEDHPLALGMPGMHGWVHVNRAIQECDLLISIGARFDDRVTGKTDTFARNAKIIHIDIDPAEISKNITAHLPIIGDAKRVLRTLIDDVEPRTAGGWLEHVRDIQHSRGKRAPGKPGMFMPHHVYAELTAILRGEFRICTDVGQHQMWAAQPIDYLKPHSHITSGGLGTMGFALPAGIGVQMACPDEEVWTIAGDGGWQMNIQELATVVQEGLPLKMAIINNGYLGMVRQWQELFHERRYSSTPMWSPDFIKVGEAYGIPGLRVERQEDVAGAIHRARGTNGPFIIEFVVEREVNVYPMVAPGASISDMFEEPALAQ